MTAEVLKYTMAQVEALELAPGTEHEQLEGSVPSLATEQDLKDALEKAFDYRGDITITLKSGEKIEAYIFNRLAGATLSDSFVQYFTPNAPDKRKLAYDQIARLEFFRERPRRRQALGRLGQGLHGKESRRRKEHRAGSRFAGVAIK
ncbi:MAG: hypothetical protein WDM87_03585 [Terracidiphilus sp.]